MRLVVEKMLGRKVHLFHVPVRGGAGAVQAPKGNATAAQVRTIQVRAEAEQVQFQAKGSVQTADGRQIDFQAELTLSRQFVEVVTGDGAASGKRDPLVLNFDGRGVRLLGTGWTSI
jgi:hypothetical protein